MAAAGLASCLDFVEPELPERGAPAVARISVVLTDSGAVALNGTLAPGFDDDGLRRVVRDASVTAAGEVFLPTDTAADGSLVYVSGRAVALDVMGREVQIRGQVVEPSLVAPLVTWPGLRTPDPDTVRRGPDGSLRLHVETVATMSQPEPAPSTSQWFLTLTGADNTFRLSADGPPPEELEIPAQFVPAGPVAARLIYQQSATLQVAPTYLSLIMLDLRIHWTIPAEAGS